MQLLSRVYCVVLSLFSQNRVELSYPGALETRNYEALYPASGEKKCLVRRKKPGEWRGMYLVSLKDNQSIWLPREKKKLI